MIRLVSLRRMKNLSQAELGRRAKIHPSDVSRFESGMAVPYPGQLRRLARALGVSADQADSLLAEAIER